MKEAVIQFSLLNDPEWQRTARELWDRGEYLITVAALDIEEMWRHDIEQWLINHGIVYTKLILKP